MNRTRKLDYYVAGTFLGPFLLCLVTFISMYVVIDFFSNVDKFLSRDYPLLTSLRMTVVYYALVTPSYLAQIMPILVVVPGVVTIMRLERANEICAMRSSGISGRRISLPIIACTSLVMILAYFNQELLVPALHEPLLSAERDIREREGGRIGFSYVIDQYGRHMLVSRFDHETTLPTLTKVRIAWEDNLGVHHERDATRAVAPADPRVWYMEGVRRYDGGRTFLRDKDWERVPDPESFSSPNTEQLLQRYRAAADRVAIPLITTEPETPQEPYPRAYEFGGYTETGQGWPVAKDVEIIYPAEPQKGRLRIEMMVWVHNRWFVFGAWKFRNIDPITAHVQGEQIPDGTLLEEIDLPKGSRPSVQPSDIRGGEFKQQSSFMTLGQLAGVAARFQSSRFRQRCWVIIWNRVVFPLAGIVLVLLTIPLVFRQGTHSSLVGVGIAILLTFLYMTANFVSIDMAYRQVAVWNWPPLAGTFPTVLFALVAVWVFVKIDEV